MLFGADGERISPAPEEKQLLLLCHHFGRPDDKKYEESGKSARRPVVIHRIFQSFPAAPPCPHHPPSHPTNAQFARAGCISHGAIIDNTTTQKANRPRDRRSVAGAGDSIDPSILR